MPNERIECKQCKVIKDSHTAYAWINGKRDPICYQCLSIRRQKNKLEFLKKLIAEKKNQKKTKNYFLLEGKPKALKRPRARIRRNKWGQTVQIYCSQENEKHHTKIEILEQLRQQKNPIRHTGPIAVHIIFHVPMGSNRCQELNGTYSYTKPDLDNLLKYYLDVMNDLVYEDDRQISEIHCRKVYSRIAFTEILITPLSGGVLSGHVLKTKEEPNDLEIESMLLKANLLGLDNRRLHRCFFEEDEDGRTYFFEADEHKEEAGEGFWDGCEDPYDDPNYN